MPDVQFQEDTNIRAYEPETPSGLMGLVIKFGLAKNEKDAQVVLIGILILLLVFTFFMLYRWQASTTANMPPPLPEYIPR